MKLFVDWREIRDDVDRFWRSLLPLDLADPDVIGYVFTPVTANRRLSPLLFNWKSYNKTYDVDFDSSKLIFLLFDAIMEETVAMVVDDVNTLYALCFMYGFMSTSLPVYT